MTKIPKAVEETPLSRSLLEYLPRTFQGKVRDTYKLPDSPEHLLVVATDRISVFDIVLGTPIPGKGKVLTKITGGWLEDVLGGVNHHLVAVGPKIDRYLPKELRENCELHSRALVVKKLQMCSYEAVVRGYLTGTAWAAYRENDGNVWGHKLPAGLQNGGKLPEPIFTPTTKSREGHDEPIPLSKFQSRFGLRPGALAFVLYAMALEYAKGRGLIIADTKFEFGYVDTDEELIVGDEVLTPDSSRFWSCEAYEARKPGTLPPALDKQFVRDYINSLETPFFDGYRRFKVSELDLDNKEHVNYVHGASSNLPQEVIDKTVGIYSAMPEMLFGESLAFAGS